MASRSGCSYAPVSGTDNVSLLRYGLRRTSGLRSAPKALIRKPQNETHELRHLHGIAHDERVEIVSHQWMPECQRLLSGLLCQDGAAESDQAEGTSLKRAQVKIVDILSHLRSASRRTKNLPGVQGQRHG